MLYYHNPKCSKSRLGIEALTTKGVTFTIKEYLKEGVSPEEIKGLSKRLNLPVKSFVRSSEAKELGIELSTITEADLIDQLVANPILLERPILDNGTIARIGRPTEAIFEVIPNPV